MKTLLNNKVKKTVIIVTLFLACIAFAGFADEAIYIDANGNVGIGYTSNLNGELVINGNVGIGTTSPSALLDVEKSSTSTTAANEYASKIVFSDTGVVTGGSDKTYGLNIDVDRTGPTGGYSYTYGIYSDVDADDAGAGTSRAYGTYSRAMGADYNYGLYAYVSDTTAIASYGVYSYASNSMGTHYGVYSYATGTTAYGFYANVRAVTAYSFYGEHGKFYNADNVGIGTTSPSSKLHVNGGDIRVSGGSFIDDGTTLNVPDYVFEDGYKLMSLNELENYINKENHLPNIPNSEKIKENGLNISEFQMKLLEKIEELTLYTLEQQKKIESLKSEFSLLAGKDIEEKNLLDKIIDVFK